MLGADFSAPNCVPTFRSHFENARRILGRLRVLPVPMHIKESLYKTRVATLLAWGFGWVDTPTELQASWTSKLRATLRIRCGASRDLWQLLAGHWSDTELLYRCASLATFARACQFRKGHNFVVSGPWRRRVPHILGQSGFEVQGPMQWFHPDYGLLDLDSADWSGKSNVSATSSGKSGAVSVSPAFSATRTGKRRKSASSVFHIRKIRSQPPGMCSFTPH